MSAEAKEVALAERAATLAGMVNRAREVAARSAAVASAVADYDAALSTLSKRTTPYLRAKDVCGDREAVRQLFCPCCHAYASKPCAGHYRLLPADAALDSLCECRSCHQLVHACCLATWWINPLRADECPSCDQTGTVSLPPGFPRYRGPDPAFGSATSVAIA